LLEQLIARNAERLGGAVEIHAVPAFVLNLRHQHGLAAQRRRPRDPVAFRQHADDLGVRVLGDLADERLTVGVGHPVFRLDALFGVYFRLEALLQGRAPLGSLVEAISSKRIKTLCVHPDLRCKARCELT
jgi:hypothetical protein